VKAVLISNPNAGRRVGDGDLDSAVDVLKQNGWSVAACASQAPGDATVLAREAAEDGVDVVLVAGGDGTLNEVIQALAGTEAALGYLPYGTVNVWARELSIPTRDPARAARAVAEGRTERIDLGVVNGRYFLLMASLGFDSEVVRRAQRLAHYKARFGILPYVAAGLGTVPLYRGADVELRYDGNIRRVHALMLVVGNTRLYGGWWQFTPRAVANDGWLDVSIVKGRGPISLVRHSFPLLLSRTASGADVEMLRVRELSVRTDTPLPLQVDGELEGATPAKFGIAPRALKVIVPNGFASDLIA
jgi:YegS/Rv2252/BmrU family lipid kinase